MADTLRRDSATATVGLTGVGTAAALRHTGLEQAYDAKKRPPLAQELKLLRRGSRGRMPYLAGAALGTLAVPTTAVGVNRTIGGIQRRVSKTYLGLGQYARAVDLTAGSRNNLRRSMKGRSALGAARRGDRNNANGKIIHPDSLVPSPKGRNVTIVRSPLVTQSTAVGNGKRGGVVHLRQNADHTIEQHELAHLAARRNPLRKRTALSQGREEARADYLAQRTTKYPTPTRFRGTGQGSYFQQGYREVTGAMTRAGTKRGLPTSRRPTVTRVDKADQPKHHSYLADGVIGAKDAVLSRNQSLKSPAPVKLQAGNYLAGGAVGSLTGGMIHRALTHTHVPGAGRAALASMAGITAGTAALPAQSAITRRVTHGQYEVTPTGVRRVGGRRKPVRPSAGSTVIEARTSRGADPRRARSQIVGKRGEGMAAATTSRLWTAASRLEGTPAKSGKLVRTAALGLAGGLRSLGANPTPLAHGATSLLRKDYYGSDMGRREKRLRVQAVGGAPVVGDFAQAAQAGRMAPGPLQRKTAAAQYAGNVGGGVVGQVGGAALALEASRRSAHIQRGTVKVADAQEKATNWARGKAGLKPTTGPGMAERGIARAAEHARTPKIVARGLRAAMHNPKAATVGALAGSAIAGTVGGQVAYGHGLNVEDKYRRQHGMAPLAKADAKPSALTVKDKRTLAHRKERNASLSQVGGATGVGALVALGASRLHPKLRPLRGLQTPLLTTGAGVGGINAFVGASVQRKEAQQQLAKSWVRTSGAARVAMDHGRMERKTGEWLAATRLSEDDKRQVRMTVAEGKRNRRFGWGQPPSSEGNHLYANHKLDRGQLKPTVLRHQTASPRDSRSLKILGTAQPNGRGGGAVDLFRGATENTARHEQAHIAPRRNPLRFFERTRDETRHGREEGRADYLASGHHSSYAEEDHYPGTPKFRQGYAEVQDRMRAAGTKVHKSLLSTGVRRAPSMRSGFVRQTRYRNGIVRSSTVRGGLA